METELWKQALIERDAYKIKAERNAMLFRGMSLLYETEYKSMQTISCRLCGGDVKKIAIYGAGKLGKALASLVLKRGCSVDYFVDRRGNAVQCDRGVPCILPSAPLPDTDLMVITPEYDYDDIATEMKKAVNCPIIALTDFLREQMPAADDMPPQQPQTGRSGQQILFPFPDVTAGADSLPRLEFKTFDKPKVSIIIPVYNEFAYTYCCLKSILKNTSQKIPYEVIVGDDRSDDLTVQLDSLAPGITVIRNDNTLRFLKNCNVAAAHAKGEYILFLNNDTQVQPDWLPPLIDLLDSNDTIGLVGSKLIYPNGSIWEAGGIIWNDATGLNYGRGQDPTRPEFNYVKDVDYISGASIMIRTSLWNEIGGFDEQFCPAYFEDSDLAFEVRKHGYRVVYQPESEVIHFGSVSSGTELASGQRKNFSLNTAKFLHKWKDTLNSGHPGKGTDIFYARDRSFGKRTVLVINDVETIDDRLDVKNTVLACVRGLLADDYNVKLLDRKAPSQGGYAAELRQEGVESFCGREGFWYFQEWFHEYGANIDGVRLVSRIL